MIKFKRVRQKASKPFTHYFRWAKHHGQPCLPGRKGQRCRILLTVPRTNSVVLQFEDGFLVNTSRNAVRKIQKEV